MIGGYILSGAHVVCGVVAAILSIFDMTSFGRATKMYGD